MNASSSRSRFVVLYPFRMSHAFRWAYVLLLASPTPFAAVVVAAAAACVVGIVAVVAAAVMSAWLLFDRKRKCMEVLWVRRECVKARGVGVFSYLLF